MVAIVPKLPNVRWLSLLVRISPRGRWAMALSFVIHAALVVPLAWLIIPPRPPATFLPVAVVALPSPPEQPIRDLVFVKTAEPLPTGLEVRPEVAEPEAPAPEALLPAEITLLPIPQAHPKPTTGADLADLPTGGGLSGRRAEIRERLALARGGTPASEVAVVRGLAWLAAHQQADGSWRFDHQAGPCQGQCRDSGREKSTTAATGLALLPFLGAGHTHLSGEHRGTVARGLLYLISQRVESPRGGDLRDGSMYGQGLATLALCEAGALTEDPDLLAAGQSAIEFIVRAQHSGGGWRYFPGQAGDITVLGWQWMALRGGQLAGLPVPTETLVRAGEFLDGVQADGGVGYGYQLSDRQPTSTAIGLLCRMYSGWRQSDPRLARGAARLAKMGPSLDDPYFNYHATQVLHHLQSAEWPTWNERLRERLIATQADRGHEAGSWHFADPHTAVGGRLCDTALCLLTLEVYYRYLPLYGEAGVEMR